jgi:hypothetical protein
MHAFSSNACMYQEHGSESFQYHIHARMHVSVVYIYIYIYIYIHVYIHRSTHLCSILQQSFLLDEVSQSWKCLLKFRVCMYLYTYVSIYICIYIHMYLYTYVSIYICIYVHVYVSIYICICPFLLDEVSQSWKRPLKHANVCIYVRVDQRHVLQRLSFLVENGLCLKHCKQPV